MTILCSKFSRTNKCGDYRILLLIMVSVSATTPQMDSSIGISKFRLRIPYTILKSLSPQTVNRCSSIMATRASSILCYFADSAVNNNKVSCKICSETVLSGRTSSRTYNTSNLRKHLQRMHSSQFRLLEDSDKGVHKTSSSQRSMT